MSFVAEQNKSESLSNDETFQASATLVNIAGTLSAEPEEQKDTIAVAKPAWAQ